MRLTFGDELDHGLLSCRQSSLAGARSLQQKALEERLRDLACEEGLVIGECLNGGDEKAARIGLKKESTSTSLEHVPTRASVSCIVKIRISTRESLERICRVASTPLSVGRPKSRTATSGRVAKASSTASLPSEASATTSQPACDCRIVRSPARTTSWSSAIRIRVIQVPRPRHECPSERCHPIPISKNSTCWNPYKIRMQTLERKGRGRRARVPRTKSRLFQRLVIHFRLRRERDHRNDREGILSEIRPFLGSAPQQQRRGDSTCRHDNGDKSQGDLDAKSRRITHRVGQSCGAAHLVRRLRRMLKKQNLFVKSSR